LPFFNKKLLPIALLGGLASSVALVFTGCRGAYIAFFFELVVLVLVIYKFLEPKFKKIFTTIIGFCALALSFVVVSTASLRARIFSIFAMRGDSSNSFRFNVYNSCVQMFKDNWLLGIGCGNQNFREIYGLYMKTGFDALSAYNIYLETAVESGLFALISFLAFLGVNIIKALKFIFSQKSAESVFVLAATVSIIGILTHGMVDTVFFRPQIQFTFWIMIGIIRVIIK
jgi:putative inorganic carbon (HCO3(-)) transporter